MRLAIIGAVLLFAGAVAIATGALPFTDLTALVAWVAPILLFVVAMPVVTELCSEAGARDRGLHPRIPARPRRISHLGPRGNRKTFHNRRPRAGGFQPPTVILTAATPPAVEVAEAPE
jgi:hypothetical protein